MRKLREVLRLRFELHLGYQQIGRSCAIGVSTVCKYRVLSVGLRKSETVALGNPVMPVRDGLLCGFIWVNGGQLRKGNCHVPPLPADQNEHVAGTGVFRGEAAGSDDLTFPGWRNYLGCDAVALTESVYRRGLTTT